jgi:hypothetical protein
MLVRSPDADRAAALLDGRVDRRDGDRLLVRHPDPAQLNQQLVSGESPQCPLRGRRFRVPAPVSRPLSMNSRG